MCASLQSQIGAWSLSTKNCATFGALILLPPRGTLSAHEVVQRDRTSTHGTQGTSPRIYHVPAGCLRGACWVHEPEVSRAACASRRQAGYCEPPGALSFMSPSRESTRGVYWTTLATLFAHFHRVCVVWHLFYACFVHLRSGPGAGLPSSPLSEAHPTKRAKLLQVVPHVHPPSCVSWFWL